MEMADYERSLLHLNEEVKRLNELVESKGNENSSLNKELGERPFRTFPNRGNIWGNVVVYYVALLCFCL